jgi:hypothetical protein
LLRESYPSARESLLVRISVSRSVFLGDRRVSQVQALLDNGTQRRARDAHFPVNVARARYASRIGVMVPLADLAPASVGADRQRGRGRQDHCS